MGRRPNAVIAEYFERGPPRYDSSNRYQQKCKSCGEDFPTGRIENLKAHITKSCRSLSLAERTRIVLRLHNLTELPTLREDGSGDKDTAEILPDLESSSQNIPGQPAFDRLNVLAEASRQVNGRPRPQGSLMQDDVLSLDTTQSIFENVFQDSSNGSFAITTGGRSFLYVYGIVQ